MSTSRAPSESDLRALKQASRYNRANDYSGLNFINNQLRIINHISLCEYAHSSWISLIFSNDYMFDQKCAVSRTFQKTMSRKVYDSCNCRVFWTHADGRPETCLLGIFSSARAPPGTPLHQRCQSIYSRPHSNWLRVIWPRTRCALVPKMRQVRKSKRNTGALSTRAPAAQRPLG